MEEKEEQAELGRGERVRGKWAERGLIGPGSWVELGLSWAGLLGFGFSFPFLFYF